MRRDFPAFKDLLSLFIVCSMHLHYRDVAIHDRQLLSDWLEPKKPGRYPGQNEQVEPLHKQSS